MSDPQKGLVLAGDACLPNNNKAKCCKHLKDNARNPKNAGPGWDGALFHKCQQALTPTTFKEAMATFDAACPRAAQYFNNISHSLWARYKQHEEGMKMYGWCNSNFVESENSRLLNARAYSPLGCCNMIALEFAKEANEARLAGEAMRASPCLLTPFAEKRRMEAATLSRTCSVKQVHTVGCPLK